MTVATAGAALDVSGVVGAPNYAPGDLPIQKDTSYGADGQPGDHGGAGAAGGSIGLYAAALTGPDGAGAAGPLTLNAAGGAGGRGQDGGSGQPAPADGSASPRLGPRAIRDAPAAAFQAATAARAATAATVGPADRRPLAS